MKLVIKNCEVVFSGLKMIANTSSDVMNKYIKTIRILNANTVKFSPTGKFVIRHYIDNGEAINWQLFQTESFDSNEVVVSLLAASSSFGSGDKVSFYGTGKNAADGSYLSFVIEGDIDGYKSAIEETNTTEIVDIYNTINFMG